MSGESAAKSRYLRFFRRRYIVSAVVAALLVLFSGATVRTLVWPPLPPLPARADAIVEYAGTGNLRRDAVAVALAREGRGAYLVQSTVVAEAGTSRCLPEVPGVTVLCFHPDPETTRGEAEAVGRLAQEYGWTSVILVTTPDQALRATLRTSRCFSGRIYNATAQLPAHDWPLAVPYQWAAFAKAFTVETTC